MTVKVIVAQDKLDCDHLLGSFLDHRHYDLLIEEDCDFYAPPEVTLFGTEEETEEKCVFKFRKGFFTAEEQVLAYEGLREAATPSQNRGTAAGERGDKTNNDEKTYDRQWVTQRQIDILELFIEPLFSLEGSKIEEYLANRNYLNKPTSMVWLTSKIAEFDFEEWAVTTAQLNREDQKKEAMRVMNDCISKTQYANQVYSGVAGYFGRYPRNPYGRATAYTQNNREKFEKSYALLQKLAKGFKELLPERYAAQEKACKKIDEGYVIPGTPFTTLTVNKTFRTAAHLDAGDLEEGFSNLSVLTNGAGYSGGYLVLPEFRVAVNIRPGDLLLVANHSGIHGNTEIKVEEGGERISLVAYFRENMLQLGEKVYEDTRYEFVESCRKNPDHPNQRTLWNGVYPGMFESEEWYDFLNAKLGADYLKKYHPTAAPRNTYSSSCSYKSGGSDYDCSKCERVCSGVK